MVWVNHKTKKVFKAYAMYKTCVDAMFIFIFMWIVTNTLIAVYHAEAK